MKLKTLFGIIGIGIFVYLCLWNLKTDSEGKQQLIALSTLEETSIREVSIYDRDGETLLMQVTNSDQIASFCSAIRQMESWSPSHPELAKKFYTILKLEDGQEYQFQMCLKDEPDRTVYIYGIRKDGMLTSYLYRTKSSSLGEWFVDIGIIEPQNTQSSNKTQEGIGEELAEPSE